MARFQRIAGAVALLWPAAVCAAETDRDFARAHGELTKRTDLQFTLDSMPVPKMPQWLDDLIKFIADHHQVLKYVLWGALGLGAAIILYTVIRKYGPLLLNRPARERAEEPKMEWRPTEAVARRLLDDADALAARGEYGEAVHLILLRSIDDIQERRPRAIRRTFTSREIGRLDALPSSARGAFAGIVRAVERSLFAGIAVDAAEYARCRSDYEAFAFAPAWQRAA